MVIIMFSLNLIGDYHVHQSTNTRLHIHISFVYLQIYISKREHKPFQSFGIRSSLSDSLEIKLDMLLKVGNFAQYIEPSYRSRRHAGLQPA
jgi:hypothetical protein